MYRPPLVLLLAVSFVGLCLQCPGQSDRILFDFADDNERFAKAGALPAAGAHELRIISSRVLELYMISGRNGKNNRPAPWDWIEESTRDPLPAFPSLASISVLVNGSPVTVTDLGFRRKPYHAPLNGSQFLMDNSLFLKLAADIPSSAQVRVTGANNALGENVRFEASASPDRWNPAIHVTHVGFDPQHVKVGQVGYWLGPLGEWDPQVTQFQVVNRSTGAVVHSGQLKNRLDLGWGWTEDPYQNVLEADFTDLATPGEYQLKVPGIGRSFPFRISPDITGVVARTFAHGLFQIRSGQNHDFPHTRFTDGPGHVKPIQIPLPESAYSTGWSLLRGFTNANTPATQTAPKLLTPEDQLFPFVNTDPIPVVGGHMDAGDYSKYTYNSALTLEVLTFAADNLRRGKLLDNLGIPESGDGISDLLQEARWEALHLSKMQDADGGFYFLVYPKARRYEQDVLPSNGDQQIAYPKNTISTGAATGALAGLASSPAFRQAYPAEADQFLLQALAGWEFLTNAIDTHGYYGCYQGITHYGSEFWHNDEMAWAAAALFAATGDKKYEDFLKDIVPEPGPDNRRWTWYKMAVGWGAAFRSYAFGARSGRIPASAYDSAYLQKIETEILEAGRSTATWCENTSYGLSLSANSKRFGTISYIFPASVAFDAAVADAMQPDPRFEDALLRNLYYSGGGNANNQPTVSGLGWTRRHVTVSQFAENDQAVLPPSGLPLGAIQTYPFYQTNYLDNNNVSMLTSSIYPHPTGEHRYPFFDRWWDTWDVNSEYTVDYVARATAAACYVFAGEDTAGEAWEAQSCQIAGLPDTVTLGESATVRLESAGLDLTDARVMWEISGRWPEQAQPFTFSPVIPGINKIEAEGYLPDGRRFYVRDSFQAAQPVGHHINDYQTTAVQNNPNTVAYYPLGSDLNESENRWPTMTLRGNARLDRESFVWTRQQDGGAVRCDALEDYVSVTIPTFNVGSADGVSVEGMLYAEEFVGYAVNHANFLTLSKRWNIQLNFKEDKWGGPRVLGANTIIVDKAGVQQEFPMNQWVHFRMVIDTEGYRVYVDNNLIGQHLASDLSAWNSAYSLTLRAGQFKGWIDDLVVKRFDSPESATRPVVSLEGPSSMTVPFGETFVDPGYSATDSGGGTLDVTVTGTVNTNIAATYVLVYEAQDGAGLIGRATRKVQVLPGTQAAPGSGAVVADYSFASDTSDATGKQSSLTLSGSATVNNGMLSIAGPNDRVTVSIPGADVYRGAATSAILLDGTLKINAISGSAKLMSLGDGGAAGMALNVGTGQSQADIRGGQSTVVMPDQALAEHLSLNSTRRLRLVVDSLGYRVWLDNDLVAFHPATDVFSAWQTGAALNLEAGGFTGEIHRLRVVSIQPLPGGYQDWLALHFTAEELADEDLRDEVWGETADMDGDGLITLHEYGAGGDPKSYDKDLRSQGGVTDVGEETFVSVTFHRNPAITDMGFQIMVSEDLVNWRNGHSYLGADVFPNGETVEVDKSVAGDIETIIVRSTMPLSKEQPRQFIKVVPFIR